MNHTGTAEEPGVRLTTTLTYVAALLCHPCESNVQSKNRINIADILS